MHLHRYPDIHAFRADWEGFLLAREAENNLLLGLMSRVAADPGAAPALYLAGVWEGARPIGAALRTHPHTPLDLSAMPLEALRLVVADVAGEPIPIVCVVGPHATAHAFADLWRKSTGCATRLRTALGVYQLTAVVAPEPVPGALRAARVGELDLLRVWNQAFHEDAGLPEPPEDPTPIIRRSVEEGRLFVWDDGGPVSQAQVSRETQGGISLNAVYTPPALRGRGYASNCVAAVSQAMLDRGRRFVFLFTDLANPTSNKIYQRIGYRHVCDFAHVDFEPQGPREDTPAS